LNLKNPFKVIHHRPEDVYRRMSEIEIIHKVPEVWKEIVDSLFVRLMLNTDWPIRIANNQRKK